MTDLDLAYGRILRRAFLKGRDTAQIATAFSIPEAQVERLLHLVRTEEYQTRRPSEPCANPLRPDAATAAQMRPSIPSVSPNSSQG